MTGIENYRHLSDEAWLNVLVDGVAGKSPRDLQLPSPPESAIQSQFVGSSGADALREAYYFYSFLKSHAHQLGNPVSAKSRILDFGCGWGRYLRFFWKDVEESGLNGVDIDPAILDICRETGVPGNLQQIEAMGRLPFDDGSLDIILAFSVFTHLPENVHLHWMGEFKRVVRPGGVVAMTLEPRRFLQFVADLKGKVPESGWHAGLQRFADLAEAGLPDFDKGKLVYLPTGGGDYRAADIYGDAACPVQFMEKAWAPEFRVVEYTDDPRRFWQAAIALQRL